MTDDWRCPYCGREESDEPPHCEIQVTDEIAVDVTCETVYLMRDDGYGIALDYDEFERVIDLFERSK